MENLKTCAKCATQFDVSNFYLKSGQPESICKGCKKTERRKKYALHKSKDVSGALIKMHEIVHNAELRILTKINGRLEEILCKYQNKEVP